MVGVKVDPEVLAHLEWLGFVRPTGLVVSAPALVRAGAILDRHDADGQRLLRACVTERSFDPKEGPVPHLPDFRSFAESVLNWNFSPKGYAGTIECPIPTELEVPLPDYGETLRPDFAVRELEPKEGASSWQLLVWIHELGEDFDCVVHGTGQLEASAHGRMERLLRQTGVPAGLLFNGSTLRLVSAPRGESSGWIDFRVSDMVQTGGRPISTALRLLLGQTRLLSLPRGQRLAALFDDSRKFQNEVSERLAEQVLHALYELLRGFQTAHNASNGKLLCEPLTEHPDEIYRALLTVILRLIFLLYAEERDMLPEDETFLRYYSLAGLYERLREDAALYPDTMDQRYGAWAQLLVLFRMIHDGAQAATIRLPERQGVLFDPDRFKFLEGRPSANARQVEQRIESPLVPDGTIYRALEKLLVLDGERISYRALDVEQIGSVYETMMGFRLETATGPSVAIKAQKKQGAPTVVDLERLLAELGSRREKWLQDQTDRKLTDAVKKEVAAASTLEDLHAALIPLIDSAATPDLAPKGALVLQPSEERRKSGSHYTPRALTEPIVRVTLEPILTRLRSEDGRPPRPAQILDLKICDPAMGSGAFLVEACRQLGDALVEAWRSHGEVPPIPTDEDQIILARRLVALRCLYGVDRNPIAVDLAKVSLWLITLAKDHALSFMDHALRHGDSLVGLSQKQIEAFHWDPDAPRFQAGFETLQMREHLVKVAELRKRIREAGESASDNELRRLWVQTQSELLKVRRYGDLVLAAFFDGDKPKNRDTKRAEYANAVVSGDVERYRVMLEQRRHAEPPFAPFHWEIEFPEVFGGKKSGFNAFVGNPPFLAGTQISTTNSKAYLAWLMEAYPDSGDRMDLVAYFFRRTFSLLEPEGAAGLIASNTIAQGDTRKGGLSWIRANDGTIFSAIKRLRWPGRAAVIVSVVWFCRGHVTQCTLDGKPCRQINAYLFPQGPDGTPSVLHTNGGVAFNGVYILGMGFTFDDDSSKATPTAVMREIIRRDSKNADRVFPYLGGEELNESPTHEHRRFVIDFTGLSESEARKYPELFGVVESKVKLERLQKAPDVAKYPWWRFWRERQELREAIKGQARILACARHQPNWCLAFLPAKAVLSDALVVFAIDNFSGFSALQSRTHEVWARFFGSSIKDDLRYTPSDCFDTFPFPRSWQANPALETAGQTYYEFRAALMVRNNEGLTKTYNRFHDPDEQDAEIAKLRELHSGMDRAVLDAYGWSDIPATCEFVLDYEIDEEEWGSKKRPYRYRWPDSVRDEILARLLELNAARAREESHSINLPAKRKMQKASVKAGVKSSSSKDLFS